MSTYKLVEVAPRVVETWGYPRVFVDGVDRTFWDDHVTVPLAFSRLSPFTYGDAGVELPSVNLFEKPGEGALSWLKPNSKVKFILDKGNGVLGRVLYVGSLSTFARGNQGGLTVILKGLMMMGAGQVRPPSVNPVDVTTCEEFVKTVLDDVVKKRWGDVDVVDASGIEYSFRGDWSSPLEMVTNCLATAINSDGAQYTVRLEGETPRFVLQRPRNLWSFAAGQPGVDTTGLTEDTDAVLTAVYGEGVDADGRYWRNAFYPTADGDDAPQYPLSDDDEYNPGQTKPGWRLFVREMNRNYNMRSVGDFYDPADVDEVRDAQREAGLQVDGTVGQQTWSGVFQVGRSATVGDAIILPLAEVPGESRVLRNGRGAVVGENPNFDNTLEPLHRYVNFGDGISKRIGKKAARGMLARESSVPIHGTLAVTEDPQEGSKFDILEDDEIIIKGLFGRQVILRVAKVTYDFVGDSVSMEVSTRRGTYTTIDAEINRRRTARDPARRGLSTTETAPAGPVWDSESGAGKIVTHGQRERLGTVTWVAVPNVFTAASIKVEASKPTEFVMLVGSKFRTPVEWENILGGNPLDLEAPWEGRKKKLRDAGLIIGWGDKVSPLGYGDEEKPDPDARANPDAGDVVLTGSFESDASWVGNAPEGFLYVVIWTKDSCDIGGRILPGVTR